ncbi:MULTISPECIES: S8 family serine peptidase [unclassified Lysobacter]|uniref:S8 family serine peptidase n=1 Tax=unclassified Lysobacter TaxID=2635362 RepID=UPI0006F3D269|nr:MULTISPECIES: S8 family serine peptidase [unclassified Lysobacter]KQZ60393.1 peptidase S8 [Lysobacter sp. Root559]KRC38878.1 peptidase S8 [Lysobacter sp. Root76]KRD71658.1 peptidase S8 [Lysobacter sp. Root96]
MQRTRRTFLKLSALTVGMMASGMALAGAQLDAALDRVLGTASALERLEVVVSYDQPGPVRSSQLQVLRSLGIGKGISMRNLPIAGALATPAQIRALAQRSDVRAIHLNRALEYYNQEARELSGVNRVQANPGDFGRTTPYTGRGVAVMINDSGIDATHADLKYGQRVIQNVQALTNLHAVLDFLPVVVLENQLNTDISSGHGTHCAGTVGGSGAQSAGLYRGVATGADLVGYGSGAVISILDAVGGYDYAISHKNSFASPIRVISNSWGSSGAFDPTDPVNLASYEAYKQGIVSVFAAGNDGPAANTHNPYAQAPWVISVGAGNKDGTLADFSSRGNPGESASFTMPDGVSWTYTNQPSLVATGVDIVSTRALTGLLPVLALPQDASLGAKALYYTHMSGTSMATPHVAGIVALLLEANPALDPMEVKQILTATANPMAGRLPFEVGSGHVDAYEAALVAQSY